MNNLAKQFLENPEQQTAIELLRKIRVENLFNISSHIAQYITQLYPNNINILEEYGISLYYTKEYEKSYNTFKKILSFNGLNQKKSENVIFNQHFSIQYIKDKYTYYNPIKVSKIKTSKNSRLKLVTFSITSCKRFDLFSKTMNSFINCCKDIDLIDEWLCIDDNSSPEDRDKMKQFYPRLR